MREGLDMRDDEYELVFEARLIVKVGRVWGVANIFWDEGILRSLAANTTLPWSCIIPWVSKSIHPGPFCLLRNPAAICIRVSSLMTATLPMLRIYRPSRADHSSSQRENFCLWDMRHLRLFLQTDRCKSQEDDPSAQFNPAWYATLVATRQDVTKQSVCYVACVCAGLRREMIRRTRPSLRVSSLKWSPALVYK